MLIIAITYQTRPQGLLSCRSHIGKREDPGDEAGYIFISGRKNVMSMRELFRPDPLAGLD